MRALILTIAALGAAAPLPAVAQSTDTGQPADTEQAAARMAEKLGNPATQQALAQSVATMGEILLDLPIAPLADAAAQMVGEERSDMDRDATLRKIAGPYADRVPAQLAERLPQMMGAVATMAQGVEVMMPQLREMAARMKDAMAQASPEFDRDPG